MSHDETNYNIQKLTKFVTEYQQNTDNIFLVNLTQTTSVTQQGLDETTEHCFLTHDKMSIIREAKTTEDGIYFSDNNGILFSIHESPKADELSEAAWSEIRFGESYSNTPDNNFTQTDIVIVCEEDFTQTNNYYQILGKHLTEENNTPINSNLPEEYYNKEKTMITIESLSEQEALELTAHQKAGWTMRTKSFFYRNDPTPKFDANESLDFFSKHNHLNYEDPSSYYDKIDSDNTTDPSLNLWHHECI